MYNTEVRRDYGEKNGLENFLAPRDFKPSKILVP